MVDEKTFNNIVDAVFASRQTNDPQRLADTIRSELADLIEKDCYTFSDDLTEEMDFGAISDKVCLLIGPLSMKNLRNAHILEPILSNETYKLYFIELNNSGSIHCVFEPI